MRLLDTNLRLLDEQLGQLAETPYFSPRLNDVLAQIRQVAVAVRNALVSNPATMKDAVAYGLVSWIWQNTQYLAGSTNKRIPYEVVFALERAAVAWVQQEMVVTTALLQSQEFHMKGPMPGVRALIAQETGINLGTEIVQCALPEIYRHRPLYCIALYHELGHFVDFQRGVTSISLLQSPALNPPYLPGLPVPAHVQPQSHAVLTEYVKVHRMEYFADLFSACYVGEAAIHFLEAFAPGHGASETHPATSDRVQVMRDFLAGTANPIVDMFQAALATRELPALQPQFDVIDVSSSFGNVRPHRITSDRELHGLFLAGWQFLRGNPSGGKPPLWSGLASEHVEGMTNDLTEKSIRSYMVEREWHATAP